VGQPGAVVTGAGGDAKTLWTVRRWRLWASRLAGVAGHKKKKEIDGHEDLKRLPCMCDLTSSVELSFWRSPHVGRHYWTQRRHHTLFGQESLNVVNRHIGAHLVIFTLIPNELLIAYVRLRKSLEFRGVFLAFCRGFFLK
jgi:hypothetical protein